MHIIVIPILSPCILYNPYIPHFLIGRFFYFLVCIASSHDTENIGKLQQTPTTKEEQHYYMYLLMFPLPASQAPASGDEEPT